MLILQQTYHKSSKLWFRSSWRGQTYARKCRFGWCSLFSIGWLVTSAFLYPLIIQGWIQTSATSFQKLVRIVKKLKKKNARKSQPLDANSSQVFNYRIFYSNCTAFVASFQRTSAFSFTEPSPHPSPSRSLDLCSICALVQISYCFL